MAETRFSYLFRLYYEAKANPAEELELMALLRAGEHDVELISLMKEYWDQTSAGTRFFDESRQEKILHHILAPKGRVRKMTWLRKVTAVAAILILIAGGYYFFEQNRKAKDTTPNVAKHDIAPGHAGAILTLSNGKQIILDSANNGALAMDGSIKVIKENGGIKYVGDNNAVVYNDIKTDRGRTWAVTLPDGTKVWLNASSSIHYPLSFTGEERLVEITGEAYFEVVHNDKIPFKVKAGNKIIEDIGTSFNINSYDDEPAFVTTVLEGKASLQVMNQTVILNAGTEGRLSNASVDIETKKTNGQDAIAWKNGLFKFTEPTTIDVVLRQLSRWYDITIQYPNGIPNKQFWGGIQRDLPLSEVLEILQQSKVQCRIERRNLLVLQ